MFKKPVRVKTSNRMKGSERKRLKQNVLKQFPLLSEEMLRNILPNKEDLFITKLENANNVYITCYCVNKNPMFYEIDKEVTLYPTVYALWLYTDLLPYMVTGSAVFEKIARGADLMLPGVIVEYGGFENVIKGQNIAVRIAGNSAAVAVGVAAMSAEEMLECGMKGKGIIINHWYTDYLWSLGDSSELPLLMEQVIEEGIGAKNTSENLEDAMQEFEIDGAASEKKSTCEESLVPKEDANKVSCEEGSGENVCNVDTNIEEVDTCHREVSEVKQELTPAEQMDQLLESCFFQAILDAKRVELPILVTKFSAQYLHPACPEGQKIDVKKSKYKKMSKFLQEMESRGLIQIAELSKGVLSITSLTAEHECLRTFKSSIFAKERSAAKAEAKFKEEEELAKDNLGITIIEMFSVSGKTQVFFKGVNKSKGDAMTAAEVRELLTSYVKENELVSQADRRKVILDPVLSDVLFDKDFKQESVTWDVLFTRFMDKMNPCHKTIICGKESKIKKGRIDPIEVKIQQRMGNKKVTLVQKLEQFGIDPTEFAHQIQLAAASSTTVCSGSDIKSSFQEVLIQGNQTHHVAKLLDDLKVPKKYINGLDKVKSKGKKR